MPLNDPDERLGTMANDKHKTFNELRQSRTDGIDYRICVSQRNGPIAIVAPHGGYIEPATSRIAAAIAGDIYNLYCFEGLKPRPHCELHITSTNFDEPRCLELISKCEVVISVHGLESQEERVDVGGRDKELRDSICKVLSDSGFSAQAVSKGDHAAISAANICNRGSKNAGVQLEITSGLRVALRRRSEIVRFADAIRSAIAATRACDAKRPHVQRFKPT